MRKTVCLAICTMALFAGCKDRSQEPSPGAQQGGVPAAVGTTAQQEAASPESGGQSRPPHVTAVDVTPLYPKVGDTIKVDVKASDPDGDKVQSVFQWSKNDTPLPETSDSLILTNDFKRGDRIALVIIPDDGLKKGSPGRMTATIANSPPEIVSSPGGGRLANRVFTYEVKTVDKDNDSLAYSLKSAPAGMTIDQTGLITWKVPPDFQGKASARVSVTDGHGGEAAQEFAVEIRQEK